MLVGVPSHGLWRDLWQRDRLNPSCDYSYVVYRFDRWVVQSRVRPLVCLLIHVVCRWLGCFVDKLTDLTDDLVERADGFYSGYFL